jgi:hypothetical protein
VDNLTLWDSIKDPDLTLGKKATKKFKGKGGFPGTSIDPVVRIHMLTKLWGPQGLVYANGDAHPYATPTGGWGFVVVEDKQIAEEHLIRVRLWYNYASPGEVVPQMRFVEGYGCTEVVQLDAAKKSFTDAMGNAAKQIGHSSAIYLGLFDDDKYVNNLEKRQLAALRGTDPEVAPATPATVEEAEILLASIRARTPQNEWFVGEVDAKAMFRQAIKIFKAVGQEEQDTLTGAFKAAKTARGWSAIPAA